jgi:hypothetical protein
VTDNSGKAAAIKSGHLDEAPVSSEQAEQQILEIVEEYFQGEAVPGNARFDAANLLTRLHAYNQQWAVIGIGSEVRILDSQSALTPVGYQPYAAPKTTPDLLNERAFRLKMDSDRVSIQPSGKSRRIGVAEIWLKWRHRRNLDKMVFQPKQTVSARFHNLFDRFSFEYEPLSSAMQAGIGGMAPDFEKYPYCAPANPALRIDAMGCSVLLHHLRQVVCGGDETVFQWLMAWLSDIVQNPTNRKPTSVVLRGTEGCGKSIVGDVMRVILGGRYAVAISDRNQLVGNFNGLLANRLLIQCEEVSFGGDRVAAERLKDLISGTTITVNEKYAPAYSVENHARLIFSTNSRFSHAVSANDRRYAILDVDDLRVGDHAYFDALLNQLKENGGLGYQCFANLLHRWEPAEGIDLRKAPRTTGHADTYRQGLDMAVRWFFDAAVSGEGYPETDGKSPMPLADIREPFEAWFRDKNLKTSHDTASNSFVPEQIIEFWGVDPETKIKKRVPGKPNPVVCYVIPTRERALARLAAPRDVGGKGLVLEGLADLDEDCD